MPTPRRCTTRPRRSSSASARSTESFGPGNEKTARPATRGFLLHRTGRSEAQLGTDVETVDALARIGEATVVTDPAGEVRREIGSESHACAAPVLVRHET